MVERALQKEIVNYLKDNDLFCYAIIPPSRKFMISGVKKYLPDLCIVDYNMYIELKDSKYKDAHKERQERQEKVRKELELHGAKTFKITTLDELKAIINEIHSNG